MYFGGSICNWVEVSNVAVKKYKVDFWLSENGDVSMIQSWNAIVLSEHVKTRENSVMNSPAIPAFTHLIYSWFFSSYTLQCVMVVFISYDGVQFWW